MAHLLVTNDFPPKVGGIQSYLWELWRRLPPERVTVLTASRRGDRDFDRAAPFRIERFPARVLLPTPAVARTVGDLAREVGAGVVVLDPALPLGLLAPSLDRRYAVVLHGAEVTVPARLPGLGASLRRVLQGASGVIAGGAYPAAEARRLGGAALPITEVPPGVDLSRFHPRSPSDRAQARAAAGLPSGGRLVLALSRLVPRKGFDVVIAAVSLLVPERPDLVLAIVGAGRDRRRLERLAAASGAPVRFLGAVPDSDLPALVASADVLAVPCRSRWGGLEQEGFGIVFLEAAASGVPQVAGRSGGAPDAVTDGQTGYVVDRPDDPLAVALALARLLDDPAGARAMGAAGRRRAEELFSYDRLAAILDGALVALEAR